MYMPYLDTGSFFMGSDVTAAGSLPTSSLDPAASAYVKKPSLPIQPIPATLILHASLLVLAISRAFPSAHQSLHLTIYLWGKGIITDNNVAIERIGGGYTACVAALAYYWFWYVYAGNADGDGNSDGAKVIRNVRRNVIDPIPPFLRADMRGLGYVRVAD